MMPPEIAKGIAKGEVNPFTRLPYDPDPRLDELMKRGEFGNKSTSPLNYDDYESETGSASVSGSEKKVTGKRNRD